MAAVAGKSKVSGSQVVGPYNQRVISLSSVLCDDTVGSYQNLSDNTNSTYRCRSPLLIGAPYSPAACGVSETVRIGDTAAGVATGVTAEVTWEKVWTNGFELSMKYSCCGSVADRDTDSETWVDVLSCQQT